MISIEAAVRLIIYLIVGGVIFALLAWLIDFVGIPEPFRKVARTILAVLAVLVVIGALLQFVGYPVFR